MNAQLEAIPHARRFALVPDIHCLGVLAIERQQFLHAVAGRPTFADLLDLLLAIAFTPELRRLIPAYPTERRSASYLSPSPLSIICERRIDDFRYARLLRKSHKVRSVD